MTSGPSAIVRADRGAVQRGYLRAGLTRSEETTKRTTASAADVRPTTKAAVDRSARTPASRLRETAPASLHRVAGQRVFASSRFALASSPRKTPAPVLTTATPPAARAAHRRGDVDFE